MSKDIRYLILKELHDKTISAKGGIETSKFKYNVLNDVYYNVAFVQLIKEGYATASNDLSVISITMKGSMHLFEYENIRHSSLLNRRQNKLFYPLIGLTIFIGILPYLYKDKYEPPRRLKQEKLTQKKECIHIHKEYVVDSILNK